MHSANLGYLDLSPSLFVFRDGKSLHVLRLWFFPGAPTWAAGLSPRSSAVGLTQGPRPSLLGSYSPGGADRRSRGALRCLRGEISENACFVIEFDTKFAQEGGFRTRSEPTQDPNKLGDSRMYMIN